jgi:hypothetical protein
MSYAGRWADYPAGTLPRHAFPSLCTAQCDIFVKVEFNYLEPTAFRLISPLLHLWCERYVSDPSFFREMTAII